MKSAQTAAAFPDHPASMFSSFEIAEQKRPGAFVISYGLQIVVVAMLLMITLTSTAPVFLPKKYSTISLVAPTLSDASPVRQPVSRITVSRAAAPSPELPVVAAPVHIPSSSAPRVEQKVDLPSPPAPKAAPQPNLPADIPATPVANPVHTGSFGDPSGVPVQPQNNATNHAPALASVGSFGT